MKIKLKDNIIVEIIDNGEFGYYGCCDIDCGDKEIVCEECSLNDLGSPGDIFLKKEINKLLIEE